MENSRTASISLGKTAGGRSKTPAIPPSTRLQRNIAEKERRDKLNGFISELATLIPMVSNASKPLDKVSILRLAAAEMRLHFSCLNPKKYKKKPLVLPPAIMSSLDLIEKTTGGFIIVTTLTGLIVFCSKSIEDYLGYQNIDVMGHKVVKYIYEDDIKYFESQVGSVVKSLKKAHKKTKVIKAHMLQKPLPRSGETGRPRNMIFKLSVYQNDTSESSNNGSSNSSHPLKSRPQKDFGYAAVVLMFIEPVRFEPEIDITYIDGNQDVYFTRHGLKGEIIYADQRISTITGYMPADVQGTSAYQYICSSDVPIALFAQKAMFTSTDGKGVIVYRLRIRDMRCIYLQSSGQIAYKELSNEISHFVCFNRLMSEDEGSQELKKFQQRYAPQIMHAKMLQVKQNPGSTSPTTDLAFEQVMSVINNAIKTEATASTSAQTSSFACSTVTPPQTCLGITEKPSETVASPSTFPAQSNFLHSSESHSTSSPVSYNLSDSSLLNGTSPFIWEDSIDSILEQPEQRLGGGPLRRADCSSALSSSPYENVTHDKKDKVLPPEQCRSTKNKLDSITVAVSSPIDNLQTNASRQISQNGQYASVKSPNRTEHFVNINNNQFSCANLNNPDDVRANQSMAYDPALSERLTFQIAAAGVNFSDQNNSSMTDISEQLNEYIIHEEEMLTNNSQASAPNETNPSILCDQLTFNEVQNPESLAPHIDGTSSLSQMYDATSFPSLLKSSNVLVLSDLYDDVDYYHNLNSYPEADSYNNYQISSHVNSYGKDATDNGVDNFNTKPFNSNELNGLHEGIRSLDDFKPIPPVESFHSKTSLDLNVFRDIAQKSVQEDEFLCTGISEIANVNQISTQSAFSNVSGLELSDWNEILSQPTVNEEIPLNKELYSELESFFMTIQGGNNPAASFKSISEIPLGISCCSQKTMSSDTKTIYQQ